MKNTKNLFDQLKKLLEERNNAIKNGLETYKIEAEKINARYSQEVAAGMVVDLEAKTRQAIIDADQTAHDEAAYIARKLKAELADRTTGEVNQSVLAKLQAAQAFGLKLSRSEIEGMAASANGDSITLSCLSRIAEASGFDLTFTGFAELESDVAHIESIFSTPSLYAPDGLVQEALKFSPNRQFNGINYGRPDAVALSVGTAKATKAVQELDDMSKRWSDGTGYQVK